MRKLVIALLVVACGGPKEPTAPGVSSVVPTSKSTPAGSSAAVAPGSAPVPSGTASAKNSGHAAAISSGDAGKKGRLSVGEARRYMVTLINRDRATVGLSPVELDEGPPTRSGQGHAEDMASHGYLGHWGSDGSVPEQRLTEAGGSDMVLENALCFIDEVARKLDKAPTFERQEIERAEGMFFNEVPPNDGHRKNILKPAHKRVGIGIAQPIATPTELPVPCFAQEFTDPYGTYAAVPTRMKVGETLRVEGDIQAPALVGGVGLARVEAPRVVSIAELNKRRSYPVPAPYQMYWPQGFKTPIPVAVKGGHFAIEVPVSDKGQPGLYELSIWAKMPGSQDFMIVGLRTIRVER